MTGQGLLARGQVPIAHKHESPFATGCSEFVLGARMAWSAKGGTLRLIVVSCCIAIGVTLLLLAAAIPDLANARQTRYEGRLPVYSSSENAALYIRAMAVGANEIQVTGQNVGVVPGASGAPIPPGIAVFPEPGQLYVSPALQEMLENPANSSLRSLLPNPISGQIGPEALVGPRDLFFYLGDDKIGGLSQQWLSTGWVGSTSAGRAPNEADLLTPLLWFVLTAGAVILVVPIVVFLGMLTRSGGIGRELRLESVRLLGGTRNQVRRIAAGEALTPAVVGSIFGVSIFFTLRGWAESLPIFGFRIFSSDLTPPFWLATGIALLTPIAAVALAWVALRRAWREQRTKIVVGQRLLWRLIPMVLGFSLLLANPASFSDGGNGTSVLVAVGVALVLISVPLLLPVALHRLTILIPAGGPSWTLAIRRMQYGSQTTARVVGGLGLVLVGSIALQTLFNSGLNRFVEIETLNSAPLNIVLAGQDLTADDVVLISSVQSVLGVVTADDYSPITVTLGSQNTPTELLTLSCLSLSGWDLKAPYCADGDILAFGPSSSPLAAGTVVEELGAATPQDHQPLRFELPAAVTMLPASSPYLVLTPGAVKKLLAQGLPPTTFDSREWQVQLDPLVSGTIQRIQQLLAPIQSRAHIYLPNSRARVATNQADWDQPRLDTAVKDAMLLGALLTLLFAIASLAVLTMEQTSTRRRAFALAVAAGVPRSVLARAQLVEMAVPLAITVAIANIFGVALAATLVVKTNEPFSVDLPLMAGLSIGAVVMSALVVAVTLPMLRRATHPESLRQE